MCVCGRWSLQVSAEFLLVHWYKRGLVRRRRWRNRSYIEGEKKVQTEEDRNEEEKMKEGEGKRGKER